MIIEEHKPKIFIYSLLLPILWFSVGFSMDYFLPGKKLGIFGLVIIIYATVTPISWHFAKTFQRHFSQNEKIRLVAYCTAWAVFSESLALWYHLSLESTPEMGSSALLMVFAFTFTMDALFMWLGFHFIGKRVINHFLNKEESVNA